MPTSEDLLLLGVSHHTASLAVRERCAMNADELRARLRVVHALRDVRETWMISTCNRTEVLVVTAADTIAGEKSLKGALREVVFRHVPHEAIYDYRGLKSLLHLFRTAAGLDSLVLGESQILTQVRAAMELASAEGTLGELLDPLLKHALSTGKRIRRETAVGLGTLSVARAGVELAAKVFGTFADTSILVLGAGETGRLAARELLERGAGQLCVVNRTLENSERAAQELQCRCAPMSHLREELARADVIVVALEGAEELLTIEDLSRKALRHRDRPLVFIDLSVPRAVARSVGELRNVIVHDLDDLEQIIELNRLEWQRAGEEAAPVLLAEVHKFLSLRTYARFTPRIQNLRERFDRIREEELDSCIGATSSAEAVKLAHRLTARLLDIALGELKESARSTVAPESLDQAYQRFLEEH